MKQGVALPSFLTFGFSSNREHFSLGLHAPLIRLIIPLTKYLICNKDQRLRLYFKDQERLIHVHAYTVVLYVCMNIDCAGNCCAVHSHEYMNESRLNINLWHQTSLVHHLPETVYY